MISIFKLRGLLLSVFIAAAVAFGCVAGAIATAARAEQTAPETAQQYVLYVHADEQWGTPNVWAWQNDGGKNVFSKWPGEEMKKNGDWYEYDVPMFVNSIIINAGSFVTEQTVDLKELQAKDMWIVLGAKGDDGKYSANVYYTENDALANGSVSAGSGEDGGLSAGAIAGIVVGAIAAVAVAVALTLILLKKRSARLYRQTIMSKFRLDIHINFT